MVKVELYPVVARHRRMFDGVKRCTLPNQVMSLAEMLRRYVRREPLPSAKDGVYVEGDYDLEKVVKMDRVEQDEIISDLKRTNEDRKKKLTEEDTRLTEEKAAKKRAERQALKEELSQKDPLSDTSAKQP